MPTDTQTGFIPQRRLHRLSWLFGLTAFLKQFIVPLAALVLFGARDNYLVWSLVAIVPLAIGAIWQQFIYRYDYGPHGLIIHDGFFFRNNRQIDYARIENIDTERGLLHRMLGVAQVRVETSSGGKPEALIRVLGLAAVREMRTRVFDTGATQLTDEAQGRTPAHDTRTDETLLHLAPVELIRFGLIDNRGILVIAALFGVLAQAGIFRYLEAWLEPMLDALPFVELMQMGLLMQVVYVLGAIIVAIAATRVLSMALALLTLFDFNLQRRTNNDGTCDLRSRYGLLTRIAITLRQRRIQTVHQKETMLHRLFGRVSLQVEIAGGGGSDNQQGDGAVKSRELWLAPICPPAAVADLVQAALPQVSAATLGVSDWQPLAPRAQWRLFRLFIWIWLLFVTAPAVYFLHGWALLIFVAGLPLAWVYSRQYVRHTGWAVKAGILLYKHGWLTRRLAIVPLNRIQSVERRRSPFDRRYKMATVNIDSAGAARWGHHVDIAYLDEAAASVLARRLYASTAA